MDPQKVELKRELGLFDSTMIVAGSMIGSGIFIVSADVSRSVGCSAGLLLVWLLSGLITLAGALCYGELAGMMPKAGGQYVFLREAFGPLFGFLYGWTLSLVIQTGTIAAVAVAFAKFSAVLFPWFSEKHVLFTLLGLPISAAQILAIASITVLTAVNLRGVKQGKIVQNLFTVTKIVALAAVILVALTIGRNEASIQSNLAHAWDFRWTRMVDDKVASSESVAGWMLLAAMGVGMVGSLFACDAWNNLTFAAGEVANPHRTIPLSLILGTGGVTLVYVLANVGYLSALPLTGSPTGATIVERGVQFATLDRVGTAAISSSFGAGSEILMALLIMVSTFGCNNGLILAGSRVYYAMAKDGLFFRGVGTLNRNSVPGMALILQAIWASLLCLSGRYGDLLDYVVFAVLLFGILTVGSVVLLRVRRPEAERPYRTWGYPVVPAFYIVSAVAVCVDLFIYKPNYTWPGIAIVLLGVPVYFVWTRLSSAD